MNFYTLSILTLIALFTSCSTMHKADLIILNGTYWTGENEVTPVQAIAIRNNKIIRVSSKEKVLELKDEKSKIIDATNRFVMPGIIEGHGHFLPMGRFLDGLLLKSDSTWSQTVDKVLAKARITPSNEWIEGRGWHQEKWVKSPAVLVDGYPTNTFLSALTPDHPVILRHASGHALIANQKAMELAGIDENSPNPLGGKVVKDKRGMPTGVFEENAMRPIQEKFEAYLASRTDEQKDSIFNRHLNIAMTHCLENGVTSFQDAGSSFEEAYVLYDKSKSNELDTRLWLMLYDDPAQYQSLVPQMLEKLKRNDFFELGGIKAYMDGALGSHGAWLLHAYTDRPDMTGQQVTELSVLSEIANVSLENGLQMCTHAIGDRANREILNIYEKAFNQVAREAKVNRWRIEHAQHLNPEDIPRFKDLGIIASIQGIHCTSDAPFVEKRLGKQRAEEGAYVWRKLLDEGIAICNGTDVPVESLDPFENIYALVSRKPHGMEAFYPEQRLSRAEALKSYTINNAYGAFQEEIKGSLKEGKLADIIILDTDLLKCPESEIANTKVIATIVGGELKYEL